jgi:bifunctional DNA-binding transcriptional regulator/antitoxin component of YhaV-PrlF toxin-antitoxin module
MRLRPENVTKKVDGLGRVTLPKGLRDRLEITEDTELALFTAEYEGRDMICLMKPADEDKVKYRVAMEVLEELNIAVPSILEEKVYD